MGSLLFGEAQLPHRDSLAFVAMPSQAGEAIPVTLVYARSSWKMRSSKRTGAWVGWLSWLARWLWCVAHDQPSPSGAKKGPYSATNAANSSWVASRAPIWAGCVLVQVMGAITRRLPGRSSSMT